MKICTITCHDVYNYGASLQAYALMRYLEDLGHQVEIIDYKPDYLSGHYRLLAADSPLVGNSKFLAALYILAKLPGRLLSRRRKAAFDRFRDEYLKLTPIRYGSYSELRHNPPSADCYFAGSDQIWNTARQNGRDPSFYLMFAPDGATRASYAASIATDSIDQDAMSLVQDGLSAMDYISVRESTAVTMLEGFGVGDATHVLDPAFLISKEHWDSLAPDRLDDAYVLVYDFEASEEVKRVAMNHASTHGLKVYSVGAGRCDYADKKFAHAGPAEYLSLVRDAKLVVTNSYHAIVFALIFGVDIHVSGRSEGINSRMEDLLSKFGFAMQSIIPVSKLKESISDVLAQKLRISEQFIAKCLGATQ